MKFIKRTIKSCEVSFKEINSNGELIEGVLVIDEVNKDKALKKAKKELAGKGIITDVKVVEQMYAMSVRDFIANAKIV